MVGGESDQLDAGWRDGPTGAPYFLSALRRQFFVLVSVPILAGFLALAYAVTVEPLYTAASQIRVKVNPEEVSAEISPLSTHVALIQSNSVTAAVIKSVGLEAFQEASPGRLRRTVSMIRSWLDLSPVDGVADFSPESALISSVAWGVDVERVGDASLITVNYTSASPAKSAVMANAYAKTYVDQNSAQVDQSIQRRRRLLEQRAEEARQLASEASRTAEDILARNSFILINSADLGRRIADFRESLSAASAEAAAIDARLERIPLIEADGDFEGVAMISAETSELYTELKAASDLLDRLKAQAVVSVGTTRQIEENVANLRSRLAQAVSLYRENLKAEQAVVMARRASILEEREQVMAFSQSSTWAELVNAERDAATYESIHQSYLQDLENLFRQGRNVPVSFVSQARPPTAPSFPNYNVVLAFGITIGIVLGGALALLREWRRRPL